jgi:hypothetical protein
VELADLERMEKFSPLSSADIRRRTQFQKDLLDILDKEESF